MLQWPRLPLLECPWRLRQCPCQLLRQVQCFQAREPLQQLRCSSRARYPQHSDHHTCTCRDQGRCPCLLPICQAQAQAQGSLEPADSLAVQLLDRVVSAALPALPGWLFTAVHLLRLELEATATAARARATARATASPVV